MDPKLSPVFFCRSIESSRMPPLSPRKWCALCLVDDSSVSFRCLTADKTSSIFYLFLFFGRLRNLLIPNLLLGVAWVEGVWDFLTLGVANGFFRMTCDKDHTYCEWNVTYNARFCVGGIGGGWAAFSSTQLSGNWVCECIGVDAIWRSECYLGDENWRKKSLCLGAIAPTITTVSGASNLFLPKI